ncbi:MAG: WbqC family protein [Bacteroidales bacterium]|nr:WbqC family protein [Bacteroidales bacterium]
MAAGFTLSPDRVNPSTAYIEAHENYQKQSWRNRCMIASADGPCRLNYPVVHSGDGRKVPVGELQIDWSTPWMVQHQRAIDAAYHSSAYYDYYRDELFALMDNCAAEKVGMLRFNTDILRFLLGKTGISCNLIFTTGYGLCPEKVTDLRETIHPKRSNSILADLGLGRPYYQVFQQKYGFLGGLSSMDLLFNEGPGSLVYLKK